MAIWYVDFENGNDANSGVDWANAWQHTSGATAAKGVGAGDTVRVAKSPDMINLGVNATWNQGQDFITLSSALTKTVDGCEIGWASGDPNIGISHTSTTALFNNAVQMKVMPAFTTGRTCYNILPVTMNLSSYDMLSFYMWFPNYNTEVAEGSIRVVLCSDGFAFTPVDSFYIPFPFGGGKGPISTYAPITVARDGGGNLGSSIKSIGIYIDIDLGNTYDLYFYLDCVNATTSSGLNSNMIVSTGTGNDLEPWYSLMYIRDLYAGSPRIGLGSINSINHAKYYGPTKTVPLYARQPIDVVPVWKNSYNGTPVNDIVVSGTSGNPVTFSGGWNTSTSVQDGESWYGHGNIFTGVSVTAENYVKVENIHPALALFGTEVDYYSTNIELDNINGVDCDRAFSLFRIDNITIGNISSTVCGREDLYIGDSSSIQKMVIISCQGQNISLEGTNLFIDQFIIYDSNIFRIDRVYGLVINYLKAYEITQGIEIASCLDVVIGTCEIDSGSYAGNASLTLNNSLDTVVQGGYETGATYGFSVTSANARFYNFSSSLSFEYEGGDASLFYKILFHNLNDTINNHQTRIIGSNTYIGDLKSSTDVRSSSTICLELDPNTTTYKTEAVIGDFSCATGVLKVLDVYLKKDASYNGANPRIGIKFKGKIVAGMNDCVVTTSYQQFSIQYTSSENGILQLVIDCDGTVGSIYADDINGLPMDYWLDASPVMLEAASSGTPAVAVPIIGGSVVRVSK